MSNACAKNKRIHPFFALAQSRYEQQDEPRLILVRRLLSNDATKLFLFLAFTYVLAAALVPTVYNVGQFLAEITARKSVIPLVDYLGSQARDAEYALFFNRALYLSALILAPIFILSFGRQKKYISRYTPWSFALPPRAIASKTGQPLLATQGFLRHLGGGFLIGAGLLCTMGALAVGVGCFDWKGPSSLIEYIPSAFAISSLQAIVGELFFQGIILGILLRTLPSMPAILLSAALFATFHHAQPPTGASVNNPESLRAGFEFLQILGARFLDTELMLQSYLTFLTAGLILGATRYLTFSLWLPIGLHAGWFFSLRLFEFILLPPAHEPPSWLSLLAGQTFAGGFLPIIALGLTALLLSLSCREPETPGEQVTTPIEPALL